MKQNDNSNDILFDIDVKEESRSLKRTSPSTRGQYGQSKNCLYLAYLVILARLESVAQRTYVLRTHVFSVLSGGLRHNNVCLHRVDGDDENYDDPRSTKMSIKNRHVTTGT